MTVLIQQVRSTPRSVEILNVNWMGEEAALWDKAMQIDTGEPSVKRAGALQICASRNALDKCGFQKCSLVLHYECEATLRC